MNIVKQAVEIVAWVGLIGLIFYALVYCTPSQLSAEAEAFSAACEAAGK